MGSDIDELSIRSHHVRAKRRGKAKASRPARLARIQGFNPAAVHAAFFPDGLWKTNFFVNLG